MQIFPVSPDARLETAGAVLLLVSRWGIIAWWQGLASGSARRSLPQGFAAARSLASQPAPSAGRQAAAAPATPPHGSIPARFSSPSPHAPARPPAPAQPAVAHANIGELAVDCLIASYDLPLVARCEDANVLPCVGNDAYSLQQPGSLATSLELYHHAASNAFVLQQRAPAVAGRQEAFAAGLAAWAASAGFARVLLLCGLDAQFRRDAQLADRQGRYLAEGEAEGEACSSAGLKQLEGEALEGEQEMHPLLPPWTSLRALQAKGLAHALLMRFAAEGDNVPDGVELARDAHAVLQRLAGAQGGEGLQVRTPCSWAALYGRAFQREMQG
jgi:proteasome assembly chaperone 2